MTCFDVEFPYTDYPPVKVPENGNLSEYLHASNSPLLFGCRSGLCGTCLIEVLDGSLTPPTVEELEALDVYAPDNPHARLACQIQLSCKLKLRKLKSK